MEHEVGARVPAHWVLERRGQHITSRRP